MQKSLLTSTPNGSLRWFDWELLSSATTLQTRDLKPTFFRSGCLPRMLAIIRTAKEWLKNQINPAYVTACEAASRAKEVVGKTQLYQIPYNDLRGALSSPIKRSSVAISLAKFAILARSMITSCLIGWKV